MGYPIEYSGARVKELLAKANETEIRVNGWQKLASSFRDPVNLNALLSLGNFYCVYAINCPSSIVNSGPYNISVSRIDLMTYQIIDCRGAIYIRAYNNKTNEFSAWARMQNANEISIDILPPADPAEKTIWFDANDPTSPIRVYMGGKWIPAQPRDMLRMSVYDPNGVKTDFYGYVDQIIANSNLGTASADFENHVNDENVHVTYADRARWDAATPQAIFDIRMQTFATQMGQSAYKAASKRDEKTTDLLTQLSTKNLNLNQHTTNKAIHPTAAQQAAWDDKSDAKHVHYLDGKVKISVADITSGKLPSTVIPTDALERCINVASHQERYFLTAEEAQDGDSIYVNDSTPMAYFVTDQNKLGSMALNTEVFNSEADMGVSAIVYGNKKIVIISNGQLKCSTDGKTWADGPTGVDTVVYGNGRFVATSYSDANANYYSYDGETWNTFVPPFSGVHASCYGDGKFIMIGENSDQGAYSFDAVHWTKFKMPQIGSWHAIVHGNGRFVAIEHDHDGALSNVVAASLDGFHWTVGNLSDMRSWDRLVYGDHMFYCITDTGDALCASEDGLQWTMRDNAPQVGNVICGDYLFVGIDGPNVVWSKDAETWGRVAVPGATWDNTTSRVEFCNGKFLILGDKTCGVFFTFNAQDAMVKYSSIPGEITWQNIINKPTTIGEFGILDMYTDTELKELMSMFKEPYLQLQSDTEEMLEETKRQDYSGIDLVRLAEDQADIDAYNAELDNLLENITVSGDFSAINAVIE